MSLYALAARTSVVPLVMALLGVVPSHTSTAAAAVDWVSSYQSGMALARDRKVPVVVDFWARWCEPCARMDSEVWRDARVAKASAGFVMIRVDLDLQEATAQRLGVTAVPTVILMDPWETELGRHRGLASLAAVLGSMHRMPASFGEVASSMETLQSNSKNANALIAAGSFYASAGIATPATVFFERALKVQEVKADRARRDQVRIALGRLVLAAGDARRARKVFEEALRDCEPENRRTLLLGRARACERLGEVAEARKGYQKILDESPGTAEADQAAVAVGRNVQASVQAMPGSPQAVPAGAGEEPAQLPLLELQLPQGPRTEFDIYAQAVPIVDLTPDAILDRFPDETKLLRPAPGQEPLPSILAKVGANVGSFFRDFPNVSSREQIRQIVASGRYTGRKDYEHNYLFVVENGADGIRWSEDRVDSQGRSVMREKELAAAKRTVFITSGYAGLGIFFHPRHQSSSRFRLVGTDASGAGPIVVAFAQRPEVDDPAVTGSFSMDGAQCLLMLQGLVWIDPESSQIVRMHTELLAPRPDVGLHVQTTDVRFAPVRFSGIEREFWLPREVDVKLDWRRLECRNRHRYSDYRLFTVSSIDGEKKVRVP